MYSFVATASLDQREAETWMCVNVRKKLGVAGCGDGDGCWYCSHFLKVYGVVMVMVCIVDGFLGGRATFKDI